MDEGPPLVECAEFSNVLQGDAAPCSGVVGPEEKVRRLLDAYLRVPILEREKVGLEADLLIEREANRKLAEAAVVEWWESPSFWIPVTVVGVLGGILLGVTLDI